MKQVEYILVDEQGRKNAGCRALQRDVPEIGLCIVCCVGAGCRVRGSEERVELISQLVRLRQFYPETPILGMRELDTSVRNAPVRVDAEMNRIRWELSDFSNQ